MIATTTMSMAEAMKEITLEIKITRQTEWAVRIWAALILMKLGARILGCPIKIDVVDTEHK